MGRTGVCVLSEWWDRPGTPEKHREFGLDSVGDVEPLESFVQGNGGMFIDCKLKRLVLPLGKCSEVIGSQR